jgi:hypothetical protein
MPLAYLFTALFTDGSTMSQTQEDRSATVEGKNAFHDVLQRITDVEVFALHSATVIVRVDLRTGLFTLNGCTFQASDPSIPNLKDAPHFRLVYFKRHRRHFQQGAGEVGHEIEYHLGWQTTIDGKNYRQTLALS